MWNGHRRNTICIIWVIIRISGTSECIFNHWATSCMYPRKRTKLHSWHRRNNSLFTMALKSLIMKVRCQFIFLSIFIFLLLFCNIVKDIYLFTYLFIYLFCFSFKTLPEPYKPLQDNKTHRMPRLIFTHHIFIPFSNDFNFSVLFTEAWFCSHPIPL